MAGKPKSTWDSEIIKLAVQEANEDISENQHNIDEAIDDLKMLVGDIDAHWTTNGINFAKKRKDAGLPTMVFDRISGLADQLCGDLRSNPPSFKLRPMGGDATQKLADFRSGRIRAILAESMADRTFKEAATQFIQCGFANWRVVSEYAMDSIVYGQDKCIDPAVMNQVIRVKPIANSAFSVIWDRMSHDYFKADADHVMIFDWITKERYQKKYKGKTPTSIDVKYAGRNWYTGAGDYYRIAEYFKKESDGKQTIYMLPYDLKELAKLPDQLKEIIVALAKEGFKPGQVLEEIPTYMKDSWKEFLKLKLVKERKIDNNKIVRYLMSGHEMLEPEQEWLSSKYFPIIPVHGRKTNVNGKVYLEGVTRKCKNSQKMYNIGRNSAGEQLALAPKAPYTAPWEAIEGFRDMWDTALTKPYSSLYYNAFTKDGKPLPPPSRNVGPQASSAVTEITMVSTDEMRSIANIFDPTMMSGAPADMAGIAIQRRVSRSEMGNFEFRDNFADSIKLTVMVINDLIPMVEDSERQVPIRNEDGTTKIEWINQANPQFGFEEGAPKYINDMSQGIYEITVTTGPSYATQREEAADNIREIAAKLPPPYNVLMADFALKYQDFHGSSDVTERFRMGMIKSGMGFVFKPEELTEILKLMAQSEMIISQATPQQHTPPEVHLKMMEAKSKALQAELKAVIEVAKLGQLKDQHFMDMIQRVEALGNAVVEREMAAMQGGQQQGQPGQPQPNIPQVMIPQ